MKSAIEYIDYDVAQKIQREVSAMSLEETRWQLDQLESTSEANLSEEELVLLHHKIHACNLHLQELLEAAQSKEGKMFPTPENKKSSSHRLLTVLVIAGIILALIYCINNLHTCDKCGNIFLGDAYYDPAGRYDVMCKSCAKDYFSWLPYENYKIR